MTNAALPASASAAAVLAAGVAAVLLHDFGSLSGHMALHLALMNIAAPIAAALPARQETIHAATLWGIAVIQIALLWAWHAPSLQRHAAESHLLQVAMHASLFAAAFCFWRGLLSLSGPLRWHAIAVLLVTGKLACLLGALLIFAPRALYDLPAHGGPALPLDDQQLAGLLMVAACPLSYVVAGIVLAVQIIGDAADPRTRPAPAARS